MWHHQYLANNIQISEHWKQFYKLYVRFKITFYCTIVHFLTKTGAQWWWTWYSNWPMCSAHQSRSSYWRRQKQWAGVLAHAGTKTHVDLSNDHDREMHAKHSPTGKLMNAASTQQIHLSKFSAKKWLYDLCSFKISLYSINLYVVSPRLAPEDGRPGNVTFPCSVLIKVGAVITADDKKRGGIQ